MGKRINTIADLTPDPANLNKGTERGRFLLETSVSKLGLGRSVLADKNGTLIAGNKTTEVAGELGMGKVRVIETDGTELIVVQRTDLDMSDPNDPRARQLAFADNQVGAQNLAWDAEALLAAAQADDLSDFVRDDELKAMIESAQEEESNTGGNSNVDAEPQIDKAEELRAKWGVETGQLWELGDHRLLCGDSTNKSEAEKVMGGCWLIWLSPTRHTESHTSAKPKTRSRLKTTMWMSRNFQNCASVGLIPPTPFLALARIGLQRSRRDRCMVSFLTTGNSAVICGK